jgi:glyceraldehyde 3-phosphate dehydrogenase
MHVRVGINGFGRTGRATFRSAYDRGAAIEWAGINDVMDIEMLAHCCATTPSTGPFPDRRGARRGAARRRAEIPVFAETDPPRCRGATSAPRS